jgi:hypothetical protein
VNIPDTDNGATVLDGFTIQGGYANTSYNVSIGGRDFPRYYGGGMYNAYSSPTLTNITITGNSASVTNDGGGMYNDHSSPALKNVTIAGNTAGTRANGGSGGGMYNAYSSPTLTCVAIVGNHARVGGGMYNIASSSPVLTNVIITGNSATFSAGGGMYNYNSSPILTNVTIAGNFAEGGGGGISNGSGTSPQIRNSIIWGNTSPGIGGAANGSVYHSIVQDGWSGTGSNNSSADPLFEDLQLATSTVPTTAGDYRLQSTSPAIDAGSNTYYNSGQTPDLSGITTDLDGNNRFVNKGQGTGGNTVDMGAYELQ